MFKSVQELEVTLTWKDVDGDYRFIDVSLPTSMHERDYQVLAFKRIAHSYVEATMSAGVPFYKIIHSFTTPLWSRYRLFKSPADISPVSLIRKYYNFNNRLF